MCTDESVIGAPFYVMQYVEGTTYRYATQLEVVGTARSALISRNFTEKLAVLHALDPVSVGLGDLGRPDGYVERQIRRWGKQFESSKSREIAGIYELVSLLEANLPPAQAPAIVHGDYRIDNVIINADDEVAAIVDWEMSTLGDPLADLGLLLVYNRLAAISSALGDASTASGYLTEAEGVASYSAVTSRDLSHLPFYIALGSFKLAVILEGIHFRFTHGQTVGEGFDLIGDVVAPVIQSGIAELR
jgi:aminoglycoside phosphotransferase (APT) family kinase protein